MFMVRIFPDSALCDKIPALTRLRAAISTLVMICFRKYHLRIFIIALTGMLVLSTAKAQAVSEKLSRKIAGEVKEVNGSPIQGASVRLEESSGAIAQQITTDVAGKFFIEAPAEGAYVLRVEKAGFRNETQSFDVPLKTSGPLVVKLTPIKLPGARGKSSEPMQFSDSTDFTVAGITDWTAAGGHGSDVNLRTSETLASDTRGLAGETLVGTGAGTTANSADLLRRRDQLRKMLVSSERADLHRQLGDVDEQLNDSLAAVHEYERATQLDSSEQNYFGWATELLLHRAIQPAVEVFTKGAVAYPSSERMLAGLGAALYASGLYAQAAERLCAASDLKPADSTPYLFLGKMTLAFAQPLPCAEEKLARFSQNQPENAIANYYYAVAVWKKAGNATVSEQIESLLNKAVRIDPKFAAAYLQLGVVYSARGEIDKAVAALKNASAADPNLAEAHFRLGQAYKKMDDAAKAREEFQAYERIQKTEATVVEQQRREIQQFVVVFKDQPQTSPMREP
jgi:tetratricopeptide (TPR) repeat protein